MRLAPNEQVAQVEAPYSEYCVTSAGRVFSLKFGKERELVGRHDNRGYPIVGFCSMGKAKTIKVHVLIAEYFIGPRPKGYDICHNDGNPKNNNVENLRYDTRAGNCADRVEHGTNNSGARNGRAKLSEKQVLEIRAIFKEKANQTAIARRFGVSQMQISRIIRGLSWGV